jgi:type IV pilus assembly protein PilX
MKRFPHASQFRSRRGIALVVALVILAVLSLIGVAAYSVATQEERMAGNSRDRMRAFEAAEAALRDCEAVVQGNPAFDGTNGMYTAPSPGTPAVADNLNQNGWTSAAVHPVANPAFASPPFASPPVCIAEAFSVQRSPFTAAGRPQDSSNTAQMARITARGYGWNPNTVVELESYYAR